MFFPIYILNIFLVHNLLYFTILIIDITYIYVYSPPCSFPQTLNLSLVFLARNVYTVLEEQKAKHEELMPKHAGGLNQVFISPDPDFC